MVVLWWFYVSSKFINFLYYNVFIQNHVGSQEIIKFNENLVGQFDGF